jgi:molybdopterin molybdotransferase
MDGYAMRSDDATGSPPYRFTVVGTSSAGHPFTADIPRGSCIRIFTGAAVPDALDAVAIQEDCSHDGDVVTVRDRIEADDNIRPAGHDVGAGAIVVARATRITQFHLAWLAACGVTRIQVMRRPRVAIFSTGDELVEPGGTLGAGQIFDANRHALRALLAALPVEIVDLGILPDDEAVLDETLAQAGSTCDAVITTGGVSVGDADYVKQAVARTGRIDLWRLNLKPGKPLAYGRLRDAVFLGLPGNPVSTIVTALLIAQPALQKLCGTTPVPPFATSARLRDAIRHRPGREEFQRGLLTQNAGTLDVAVVGDQSSNRLASFAAANCLIRIPKDIGDLEPGDDVAVLPFGGLL